ncbi:hypothetical protein SELMODRAFT_109529 [Selaginella moellendorffii]|uniref:Endoglucanase n=1 Tax=Selaginella moellendorffii TaxID=88036 RepID=D8S600_SELML|nr:hypothetical protein SELMODRAFT_109529 [Selaginella moellendorffii]
MSRRNASICACLGAVLVAALLESALAFDYSDALGKTFLYYEAQRSGRLPPSQRASWRGDSALDDGKSQGVDLVGGYYDAGDNVKFGLPMAFTITMLSWSAIEYGKQIDGAGQMGFAKEAIKWGTDYFLKAHTAPFELWGQVGDGLNDHGCWQRPEDMTTSRRAYKIDTSNPGSDLAGETAAAMAAASIALRSSDPTYSDLLVEHSKQLFEFADKYRGKYDSSIRLAQNFYTSKSGYADELLWASLWLYEATGDEQYLDYAVDNGGALGGTIWGLMEFSWDVKYPGVQVLASKILMQGRASPRHIPTLELFQSKAQFFLCAALQKNNGFHLPRTPGGLMYVRSWNNMQYVVTASFLLTVYSDYLASSRQQLQCPRLSSDSSELLALAKSQVDYILGDNPRATSYLIGFGQNYPRQVHHRASSIVSIKVDNAFVSCRGGYSSWYLRKMSDPNVLIGALVGGPDLYDNFADERYNFEQTEPATYNTGPLIGILARLLQDHRYQQSGRNLSLFLTARVSECSRTYVFSLVSQSSRPQRRGVKSVLSIRQRLVGSWTLEGQVQYKYEVTVKNTSRRRTVKAIVLQINRLQEGQYWGLTRTSSSGSSTSRSTSSTSSSSSSDAGDGSFTFPHWRSSLNPLESFVFVYINAASGERAKIRVASYRTTAPGSSV